MNQKQYVIFMVTNGAGLGHLTRALAIAKKLNKIDSNIEPVFLTTFVATEIIRKSGFMFFYIPAKTMLPSSVDTDKWVNMLKDNLEMIINIYLPRAIVFEGEYPCGAILSNLRMYPGVKSVWIKRESNKSNPDCLKEIEKLFDIVIVPQEAGKTYSKNEIKNTNKIFTSPIVLLNKEEAAEREEVRTIYEVRKNEMLFYIQLETKGDINMEYMKTRIINILLQKRNIKILIAGSLLEDVVCIDNPRIKILSDYPASNHFNSVDFAITNADYNTYHELVQFRIPTLFIPNQKTVIDDELKRAMYLEKRNAGLCFKVNKDLESQIMELTECKLELKKELSKLEETNGAIEAAQFIVNTINEKKIN